MGFESITARKSPFCAITTQTWAAFALGYDHDTPESIRATTDFALRHRFTFAAFEPARMMAEELSGTCHAACVRYNRPGALLKRFSDWQTNWRTLGRALAFWRYTLLFRREAYKKHGMRFGLK